MLGVYTYMYQVSVQVPVRCGSNGRKSIKLIMDKRINQAKTRSLELEHVRLTVFNPIHIKGTVCRVDILSLQDATILINL